MSDKLTNQLNNRHEYQEGELHHLMHSSIFWTIVVASLMLLVFLIAVIYGPTLPQSGQPFVPPYPYNVSV